MGDLSEHIQVLPAELYNTTCDLTFTYPGPSVVDIDKDYTSPSGTQVSRATREKFAGSYYGTTAFRFLSQIDTARRWGRHRSQDTIKINVVYIETTKCVRNSDPRGYWGYVHF